MREILFRGKCADNYKNRGKWVEGYLLRFSEKRNPFIMLKNGGGESVEVIPESVGQYTGLTDKNGTKIFEGDIVHAVYQSNYVGCENVDFGIGVVKYEGSYYGGAAYGIDIIGGSGSRKFTASLEHGTEVIGNIYDDI